MSSNPRYAYLAGLAAAAGVLILAGICAWSLVSLDRRMGAVERRLEKATGHLGNIQGAVSASLGVQMEQTVRDILAQPKYQDPKRLNRYEQKTFSQNGEDGVIQEIFRRIGTTNRHVVEFGSADGYENNSALLIRQGWSGLWMDGDGAAIGRARTRYAEEIKAGRLKVIETFITAENIEGLFAEHGVPAEPDLLSIDIDRNDWHVWKAITKYKPRVVIVEYNPVYPPGVQFVVPYDGKAVWDGTGRFGASLKSYELLGAEKGYRLVGCVLAGVNAFFVRNDVEAGKFAAPYTSENHWEPARYGLNGWDRNHPRNP
jgi:hypothetical protein